MRKNSSLPPLAALALGAVGFFDRKNVLDTCFDSVGLPISGAGNASHLLWYTLAVAVVCIVLSAFVCRGNSVPDSFSGVFAPTFKTLSVCFHCIVAAAMLTACALLYTNTSRVMAITVLQYVFFAFAVLAAISFIVVSVLVCKGKDTAALKLFTVIPPLFFCVWLVCFYKDNSVNPTLLDFAYQCLAIAAASLSFYYASAFCFGKRRAGLYVFTSLLAIYLCTLSAADVVGTPYLVFYAVTVLLICVNTARFVSSLSPEK